VTQPDPLVPLDKGNLQRHVVRSFTNRPDGGAADLGTYRAMVRVPRPTWCTSPWCGEAPTRRRR
jgi:hypothetical protein